MAKTEVSKWIKVLEKHLKAVGKVRDDIDTTISEMKQLRDNCDTAAEDLQHAHDALSKLA